MIEQETERLKNIQSEMAELRSSHASAFKDRPGNLAGSVTDFSPNKFVSPAKMANTMTPQTTKYTQDSDRDLRQQKQSRISAMSAARPIAVKIEPPTPEVVEAASP